MITGKLSDKENEIIKTMRNDNKSYDEIAKVLKCKKDRVKHYCRNNGLGGYRKANYNLNPVKRFITEFNKQFGDRFEYVSGYKDCKSYVKLKCRTCNKEFDRFGNFLTNNHNVLCPYCTEYARQQRIEDESRMKLVHSLVKALRFESNRKQREIDLTKRCDECNEVFKATHMNQVLCLKCKNKRDNRRKEIRKRIIKDNGNVDYSISLEKLIEKERNVCYLCGNECDCDDYIITDEGYLIVGANYPSIEHVIPVSKGGEHTWDNVRLAHHYCNTIKRDKEII